MMYMDLSNGISSPVSQSCHKVATFASAQMCDGVKIQACWAGRGIKLLSAKYVWIAHCMCANWNQSDSTALGPAEKLQRIHTFS